MTVTPEEIAEAEEDGPYLVHYHRYGGPYVAGRETLESAMYAADQWEQEGEAFVTHISHKGVTLMERSVPPKYGDKVPWEGAFVSPWQKHSTGSLSY